MQNFKEWLNENILNEQDLSESVDKKKQLEIILKNNPAEDELHTWIRTVQDIKTYKEVIDDPEYSDYNDGITPDFTHEDVLKALKTGKMTVYSSKPIKPGIFVTPSVMYAKSYSGTGKIYSKNVKLTDVAWIDAGQGQYAKV